MLRLFPLTPGTAVATSRRPHGRRVLQQTARNSSLQHLPFRHARQIGPKFNFTDVVHSPRHVLATGVGTTTPHPTPAATRAVPPANHPLQITPVQNHTFLPVPNLHRLHNPSIRSHPHQLTGPINPLRNLES